SRASSSPSRTSTLTARGAAVGPARLATDETRRRTASHLRTISRTGFSATPRANAMINTAMPSTLVLTTELPSTLKSWSIALILDRSDVVVTRARKQAWFDQLAG